MLFSSAFRTTCVRLNASDSPAAKMPNNFDQNFNFHLPFRALLLTYRLSMWSRSARIQKLCSEFAIFRPQQHWYCPEYCVYTHLLWSFRNSYQFGMSWTKWQWKTLTDGTNISRHFQFGNAAGVVASITGGRSWDNQFMLFGIDLDQIFDFWNLSDFHSILEPKRDKQTLNPLAIVGKAGTEVQLTRSMYGHH